jgi:hypothetical protein
LWDFEIFTQLKLRTGANTFPEVLISNVKVSVVSFQQRIKKTEDGQKKLANCTVKPSEENYALINLEEIKII